MCPIFPSGCEVKKIRDTKGTLHAKMGSIKDRNGMDVRLCATPQTAAHQAPPSLGFFRQEHWSGLPFPSPMHESEKSKGNLATIPRAFSEASFREKMAQNRKLAPGLGVGR